MILYEYDIAQFCKIDNCMKRTFLIASQILCHDSVSFSGLVQGETGEYPLHVSFQPSFDRGALLSVVSLQQILMLSVLVV